MCARYDYSDPAFSRRGTRYQGLDFMFIIALGLLFCMICSVRFTRACNLTVRYVWRWQ